MKMMRLFLQIRRWIMLDVFFFLVGDNYYHVCVQYRWIILQQCSICMFPCVCVCVLL